MPLPVLFLCALPLPQAAEASREPPDPSQGEVPLPAAEDWQARLLYDGGEVGIWYVAAVPLVEAHAAPAVIGLDDQGRCLVLTGYSGKWSLRERVHDGAWLGTLAHADVDPRVEGRELYVAGEAGNVYQVLAHPQGALDARFLANLPGREVHTLVAADLDLERSGAELLAFTNPGGLWLLTPDGTDGRFRTRSLGAMPGRVRDAVVLPAGSPGAAPVLLIASRTGTLEELRFVDGAARRREVFAMATGLGRLALAPNTAAGTAVVYSTGDDGRVFRHQRDREGAWTHATIHRGDAGPRGLAAGRFHADPALESIAICGYNGKVELLTRRGDKWRAETVFEDRDKGHWLAVAELDGRNETDELLLTGYGGRIVLLARPPGFGVPE
ncbi:MAG TPA: hypothetical protein VGC54_13215 [Planctomycetota bacterium]